NAGAPMNAGGPAYDAGGDGPQPGSDSGAGYGGDGFCGNGYCGNDCGLGCDLCNRMRCWWNNGALYSRGGRSYFQIDALMLTRNHAPALPLATQGTGGPVVMSTDDPRFGLKVLPRLTAGYVLSNDTAVEGTYFYRDGMTAGFDVFSPTTTLFI